jgi:hypothetical protein
VVGEAASGVGAAAAGGGGGGVDSMGGGCGRRKRVIFPWRAKSGADTGGVVVCLPTPTSAGWHLDLAQPLTLFL